MTFEWTDLTYQQILAGNTAAARLPDLRAARFLVLAAKYESLFLPLAVILIVPDVPALGHHRRVADGGDNNIFTQIGLIVLVGLRARTRS
jgi:multidrug efflux pump